MRDEGENGGGGGEGVGVTFWTFERGKGTKKIEQNKEGILW